jgi:hypothetical protein
VKKLMLTLLAVAGLSAALLAGLAVAKTKTYKDPKKDNKCCGKSFDFVKATSGHAGDNLKHTVKMKGKAADQSPFLNISTKGGKKCEFYVNLVGDDPKVVDCSTGASKPAVVVKKKGKRGFKYVFSPESIGSPKKYRWQFAYSDEYQGPAIDKAPNKPKKART